MLGASRGILVGCLQNGVSRRVLGASRMHLRIVRRILGASSWGWVSLRRYSFPLGPSVSSRVLCASSMMACVSRRILGASRRAVGASRETLGASNRVLVASRWVLLTEKMPGEKIKNSLKINFLTVFCNSEYFGPKYFFSIFFDFSEIFVSPKKCFRVIEDFLSLPREKRRGRGLCEKRD